MTAGFSDRFDSLGNKRMQEMLKKEPQWWSALLKEENKGWLTLFKKNLHFRSWYEDSSS